MSEYGKQVKKQMDTYMNNLDSIDEEIYDIQNATHGVEVRGALAAGVKKSFDKSVEAEGTSENAQEQVKNIQSQVNQLVVEGDSSVEAAQARVDSEGNTYSTLKERLDDKETEFSSQLAQIEEKQFYESLVNSKSQRAMMVILDDDTRNQVYDVIFPVIKELNVPMTFAAITGRIGNNSNTITPEQYREMRDSGLCEFISHTVNHLDLTNLPLNEVEQELKNSRKWLIENGGNPDYLVYPFNGINDNVIELTRKYYKAAFSTTGRLNNPPLRTYVINRVDFESTFEQQKQWIDEAITNNSLVIFNTHSSYPSFTEQGLRDLINYAKNVGIDIVTIGDAMKHFGNLLDLADVNNSEKYAVIDANGELHGKLASYEFIPIEGVTAETPITFFKNRSTSICQFSGGSANSAGFPGAGVLKTYRVQNDDYSYQEYRLYHSREILYRFWDGSTETWSEFDRINENFYIKSDTNEIIPTTTPSEMRTRLRNSIFTTKITSGNANGFPESEAGILTTDVTGGDGFGYQLYHVYMSNNIYTRNFDGVSWSDWTLINSSTVLLDVNKYPINESALTYDNRKISIMRVSGISLDSHTQGVLKTDRRGGHSLYIHQTFEPSASNELYRRWWNHNESKWSGWGKVQVVPI